jgi:predicted transposase YbfD/YdcC
MGEEPNQPRKVIMNCNASGPNGKQQEEGFVFNLGSLYEELRQLEDKRDPRGVRYPLEVVLVITVLAKLAGENELRGIAEWAKRRADKLATGLGLERAAMPHHTTYSRVLGHAVDVAELEAVVGAFFSRSVGEETVIAIDGKTVRGTIEYGETKGLHLLAAYLPEEGCVLLQIEVGTEEGELAVAPQLLESLDLRGRVVTGDALFAQRTLSAQIVEAGGHYLWKVKDNQPRLREDIEKLFAPERPSAVHSPMRDDFTIAESFDKGHGRIEGRTITVSSMLKDYSDWPYLEQAFKLERRAIHQTTGEVTHETLYGITSLPASLASPQRLLYLVRLHWGIENGLHYSRDVTFSEDRCRLRTGSAAHVMATINNLVLGLIRQQGFDYAPQARRFYNAHLHLALDLVLS